MILIEVRINKEVWNYQESLFFGLYLRQFLLAVLVAVGLCFGLYAQAMEHSTVKEALRLD